MVEIQKFEKRYVYTSSWPPFTVFAKLLAVHYAVYILTDRCVSLQLLEKLILSIEIMVRVTA